MKTLKPLFFAFAIVMFLTSALQSRIINVSVSSNFFSPANINNAVVGDTIKWNWVSGFHTTTCDGQTFTSRPAGAAPWNSTISSSNPTFSYVIQIAGTYNYICEPHAPSMAGIITATLSSVSQINEIATGFHLSQNFPNPFNPATKIRFSIPEASEVTLKIFDANGRELAELVNERLNSAAYEAEWNAGDFSTGVYYYRLSVIGTSDNYTETKKMLLIK
ncbi:MAG: hypothetical protein HGGPFJEG_01499 [Ignavibacteria bacterium]|nr:hypothetical protein [Ignavibacteria bacterium]